MTGPICPQCKSKDTVSNGFYNLSESQARAGTFIGKRFHKYICRACGVRFREKDLREYPMFVKYMVKYVSNQNIVIDDVEGNKNAGSTISKFMQIPAKVIREWGDRDEYYDIKSKDFKNVAVNEDEMVISFKTFEVAIRPPKSIKRRPVSSK